MATTKEKPKPKWAYMLRILGRQPERFPLDRLGEYLQEFADLLGAENKPTFGGIKKASTGLGAIVPTDRVHHAHARLVEAKTEPTSRPGRVLSKIQKLIDVDNIRQVQILDSAQNVLYQFEGKTVSNDKIPTIYQTGTVDGMVTGVVGADDTMHLHLRDYLNRDVRVLVRDEDKARKLLSYFRRGVLRVKVQGTWKRTEFGWLPETSKCTLIDFEVLEDTPVSEVLAKFAAVPGNGWRDLENPDKLLSELRGEE